MNVNLKRPQKNFNRGQAKDRAKPEGHEQLPAQWRARKPLDPLTNQGKNCKLYITKSKASKKIMLDYTRASNKLTPTLPKKSLKSVNSAS